LSGPTSFEVDGRLAGADRTEDSQFALDKGTGLISGGLRIEEGMEVSTGFIHNGAEDTGIRLPVV